MMPKTLEVVNSESLGPIGFIEGTLVDHREDHLETIWGVIGGVFARTRHAPGVCPARYYCINNPTLTPNLPSPREAPQVDHSGPQTFPTKHAA